MRKVYKMPEPGDVVEILVKGKTETGILLESYDSKVLLIKLKTGYNIGFKKDEVDEIKLIKKGIVKTQTLKNPKNNKPLIDFIICGGTISSKLDPKTGGVKDITDAAEFFNAYPEIFEKANIRVKTPFMKWSENLEFKDWAIIAKEVGKSLNDSQVKGVIVTHGTDFLHYTSAALSFMLGKVNKPVILTYSQRSSDRGSSDARMNLKCSAEVAMSDIAEVVLVGHATTNDDYCNVLQGNKCRKMHSSRRDTFRPINCKPIAKVYADGRLKILRDYNKRQKNSEKIKVDAVFDDNIALIKFYPGQNPDILDYYKTMGYNGIIIEMSGMGHVISKGKKNWIKKIKSLISDGMLIYAVPQTIYGRVDPYVYESGRKLKNAGVVYLEDILPETAFVKLGYVLGHKLWRGSVATAKKMKENIANEFNYHLSNEFLN